MLANHPTYLLFLPFTKPLRHVFTRWATLRSFRGYTLKATQVWLTKRSHNSCACFRHPPLSTARATWYVGWWWTVDGWHISQAMSASMLTYANVVPCNAVETTLDGFRPLRRALGAAARPGWSLFHTFFTSVQRGDHFPLHSRCLLFSIVDSALPHCCLRPCCQHQ